MKICQNFSLISLFWIILIHGLAAQPIITRLDSVNRCPDSLIMPVYIENFMDVASLSLKINYDTNILIYTGYQNQNPALGGSFLMNGYNNQVIISWFSLTPASIGTGILVEIRFFYTGNADLPLSWDYMTIGNCVYTDLDGTELPAIFEDGYIHGLMHTPALVLPPDQTIGVATNPILNWTGSGCAPLYYIEIATDSLFTNIVQTNPSVFGTMLNVQGLNLDTYYFWRVKAFNALHTTDWSAVSRFKTQDLGFGLNIPDTSYDITIAPNPANQKTMISIRNQIATNFTIKIFNTQGGLVWQHAADSAAGNLLNFSVNTEFLPAGLYYLLIEAKIKGRSYRQSKKLVISNYD